MIPPNKSDCANLLEIDEENLLLVYFKDCPGYVDRSVYDTIIGPNRISFVGSKELSMGRFTSPQKRCLRLGQ